MTRCADDGRAARGADRAVGAARRPSPAGSPRSSSSARARWCSSAARPAPARPRWSMSSPPAAASAWWSAGRNRCVRRVPTVRSSTSPPSSAATSRSWSSRGRVPATWSTPWREVVTEPTVLVFEDLHWADEATLDLLRVLARRLRRVPALVLATYRDDELSRTHPLRVLLGELATERRVHRMSLPLLSADGVALLAGDRTVDVERLLPAHGRQPVLRHRGAGRRAPTALPTPCATPSWRVRAAASADAPPPRGGRRGAVPGRAVAARRDRSAVADRAGGVSGLRDAAWPIARRCSSATRSRGPASRSPCLPTWRCRCTVVPSPPWSSAATGSTPLGWPTTRPPSATAAASSPTRRSPRTAPPGSAPTARPPHTSPRPCATSRSCHAAGGWTCSNDTRTSATSPASRSWPPSRGARPSPSTRPRATDSARETPTGGCRGWPGSPATEPTAETEARLAIELLEPLGRDHPAGDGLQQPEPALHAGRRPRRRPRMGRPRDPARRAARRPGDPGPRAQQRRHGRGHERRDPEGMATLERSLRIAESHGLEEHVARALTNLASTAVAMHDLDSGLRWADEGIDYCREHDLDSWRLYTHRVAGAGPPRARGARTWPCAMRRPRSTPRRWCRPAVNSLVVLGTDPRAPRATATPGRCSTRRWPWQRRPTSSSGWCRWPRPGRRRGCWRAGPTWWRPRPTGPSPPRSPAGRCRRRARSSCCDVGPGSPTRRTTGRCRSPGRWSSPAGTERRPRPGRGLGFPYERAWAMVAGGDDDLARAGLAALQDLGAHGGRDGRRSPPPRARSAGTVARATRRDRAYDRTGSPAPARGARPARVRPAQLRDRRHDGALRTHRRPPRVGGALQARRADPRPGGRSRHPRRDRRRRRRAAARPTSVALVTSSSTRSVATR